ncbi:hypothetical protein GCM10023258_33130 [Terrabacter aeriphilus]|uniref:Uncharacterized protein n=1 Tax=Terrabacter aeriphilus TaxID=515662 RepID=A0ABP9JKJ8_9MICO
MACARDLGITGGSPMSKNELMWCAWSTLTYDQVCLDMGAEMNGPESLTT